MMMTIIPKRCLKILGFSFFFFFFFFQSNENTDGTFFCMLVDF